MSTEDFEIFKRGKGLLFVDAINIYYDAGLGGAKDLPEEMEGSYKKMWSAVTQKRIDVLIETKEEWKIVEIRPRATSTAVGRLLQYKALWLADPPDSKPVKLLLLTDFPDPDMAEMVKALDIEIIIA